MDTEMPPNQTDGKGKDTQNEQSVTANSQTIVFQKVAEEEQFEGKIFEF
jgi:hypothetical protein